jgi:hypothetical protein
VLASPALERLAPGAASSAVEPPCAEADCSLGCAESCCGRHLIVGAEAVWLAPVTNQRVATYDIINRDTNATIYHFGSDAANDGLVATPRITLGFQSDCCCWGAQVRYWRMDEPNTAGGFDRDFGTGGLAQRNFLGETLDLELTRLLCVCDMPMQFTIGARYAQLQQSAGVTANQIINGELYSGSVLSDTGFSGAGFTTSLSGLRPVGCGNFNLFYSFRASLLWDSHASNNVQTWADFQSPINGWAKAYDGAFAGGDSNLFIGEIQLGGQWDFALKCIPANAFLRLAFEYQYWGTMNTGDARAFSFAGSVPGPLVGVAAGRSGDAFVNLVGFSIGTGITW